MYVKMLRAALLTAAFGSLAGTALAADTPAKAAAPAAAPAAGSPAQAADDPVVARVNGKEIHRSEVLAEYSQLPAQTQQQIHLNEAYPRVLENLVTARLLADAGYKDKLQDSKEVKTELKHAEERFVQQAYIRKQVDARMNEALLKKKYDEMVKAMPAEDEVRARHILVKTKEEADALIKQIQGGADFAKLASEQQIDKNSAASAGDLGYFTKGDMVAPFADAAFAMKPGEVSKTPVKTDFGWHVIKVEDRRKRQAPPFEQVKGQVAQAEAQDLAAQVVDELRKGAKVEAFDITGKQAISLTPPPAAAKPAAPAKQ
ncbi:peptidylprolyl isomerase [Nitrospirillum amazonense]|uniref:Parvulin-like PPIase n=1 Tax=Nitrospirillum amazonense TaxID=28077 RepID=A0A560JXY2_9PROT|nr:peptidylprolyl isomerase [Nitrospirillum amazonense]MDG3440076.1 peptidylprolyl isomerase [Nitrospirillum amazonense]TWB75599.1 peptidyl-prolyl cis-trans isomerase C [Nitrospirillum amazonense]